MSDAEWAVCEPLLPHPARPAGKGGRPSSCCMRDIVDGIPLPHAQWPGMASAARGLPVGLDRVLQGRQVAGHGSTETMHDRLCEQVRGVADRKAVPTAAIIDSQSVKAADTVGKASRGYDAGKKIPGRKRHIATDTLGLILVIVVTAASVQDRDAARDLLWRLAAGFRHVSLIWADGGYAGKLVTWMAGTPHRTLQIVKRPGNLHTFKVLPRRWVVERTFGWIMKCRRCVRDYERLPEHHETYLYWSMITVMGRRVARSHKPIARPPAAPALSLAA